jgi:acetyltransferase
MDTQRGTTSITGDRGDGGTGNAVRMAGAPGDVAIHPIRPVDADALRTFYAGLSDESRRTRFLGAAAGIGAGQAAYFCMPDHAHREGFVAVRDGRIVGHVCVEPDAGSCVEVAVAVAEDLRRRGIAKRLVEAAVEWARAEGYTTVCATMLGGNPAIQRLLTGLGLPTTTATTGAGTIEVRLDLGLGGHAAA